jgi:hypothetical protein
MEATGRRGRAQQKETAAPTGAQGVTINAEESNEKPVLINITDKKETLNEPQISINPQRRNLDADNNNNTQIPNDGVISGNYGEERKRRRGNDDIQEIDLDQLCANCCFIY